MRQGQKNEVTKESVVIGRRVGCGEAGEQRQGGDGWWGRGEEAVQGATSPDDGVLTY
jgi:hypothetical protein